MIPPSDLAVIIPAYNVAPYVGRCLESVLAAGGHGCEIVLVDDGSTDETFQTAQAFLPRFERLSIVRQANAGQSAARNFGLAISRAPFVIFVDADDLLAPGALGRICAALDPAVDITFSGRDKVLHSGERIGKVRFPDLEDVSVPAVEAAYKILAVHGKVFRRAFLDAFDLRFPEGMVWEDIVHTYRCYVHAERVSSLKTVSYIWHVRGPGEASTMQSLLQPFNIESRFRQIAMTMAIGSSPEWQKRFPGYEPIRREFSRNRFQLHVDALAICADEDRARRAMTLMASGIRPYWEEIARAMSGSRLARYESVATGDLARLRQLGPQ